MTALQQQPAPDWQPGDPLHARASSYRDGLFGFRDDTTREDCQPCTDAATWPTPRPGHTLTADDDITARPPVDSTDQENPR